LEGLFFSTVLARFPGPGPQNAPLAAPVGFGGL